MQAWLLEDFHLLAININTSLNIVSLLDHLGMTCSWSRGGSVIFSNIGKYEYWLTSVGLQDHISIGIHPYVQSIGPFSLATIKISNTRLTTHLVSSTYMPTHMLMHQLSAYHIPMTILYFYASCTSNNNSTFQWCTHRVLIATIIHLCAHTVYQQ